MAKKKKQKVSPHPYPISEATMAKITVKEGLRKGTESLGKSTGKLTELTGKMGGIETKLKHLSCVKKGGKWVKGKCVGKK